MLSKITSWRHSKVLAFVLAVAVFLTAFYGLTPVLSFAEASESPATEVGTWDGTTPTDASCFTNGDGTAANPYQITNGAQLWYAVNNTDATKHFKVMNDIVINDADVSELATWFNTSTPGYRNWHYNDAGKAKNNVFAGTFDGNQKTISGIFGVARQNANNVGAGLFARVGSNATIYDVIVENSYFDIWQINTYAAYAGGIVGTIADANNATLDNIKIYGCVVKNSVIRGRNGSAGIVGVAARVGSNFSIVNCASINNTLDACTNCDAGETYKASMVSYFFTNSGTIENCFATGHPLAFSKGVMTITNCYVDDSVNLPFYSGTTAFGSSSGVYQLAKNSMQGADAITNMNLPKNSWAPTVSYPVPVDYDVVYGFTEEIKTSVLTGDFPGLGAGTAADPYQVTNAAQLWYAVNNIDATKHFKVMNDIQVNNTAFYDEWSTTAPDFAQWTTTGTFVGTFDGNQKTISGLYVNGSYSQGIALFGAVGNTASSGESVFIHDVIVDKAYFKNTVSSGVNVVAGIVGHANGSGTSTTTRKDNIKIFGCVVKNSNLNCGRGAGGIVGSAYNAYNLYIVNCASVDNTIKGNSSGSEIRQAGIIANHWGNKNFYVDNCISTNRPIGFSNRTDVVVTDCYVGSTVSTPFACDAGGQGNTFETATGIRSIETMKGLTAFDDGNMDLLRKSQWNLNEEDYPTPKAYREISFFTEADKNITATQYAGGDGSEDNPYLISTPAQLYKAVNNTDSTKYFKVMNDIVINDTSDFAKWQNYLIFTRWYSTNKFSGNFDGNHKTISGLYGIMSDATNNKAVGLFSYVGANATIYNVIVENAYFETTNTSATTNAGGIVGSAAGASDSDRNSNVNISGCVVKDSKIKARNAAGGVVGGAYYVDGLSIDNCASIDNNLSIYVASSDTMVVAGIIANHWSNTELKLTNCFSVGNAISGSHNNITFENCYVDATAVGETYKEPTKDVGQIKTLDAADMIGVNAYNILPFLTPALGWVVKDANATIAHVGADNLENYEYLIPVWNGANTLTINDLAGEGTEENPYRISTGTELFAALQNTTAGKHFDILNDIYLNATGVAAADANSWFLWQKMTDTTSLGANTKKFSGTLNGNGHTVYGYYEATADSGINNTFRAKEGMGLIPAVSNATINDLHIRDVIGFNAWPNVGGTSILVGMADTITINGCSVKLGTSKTKFTASAYVGGFIGAVTTSATIENSVFEGIYNPGTSMKLGAFIGSATGATVTITNSVANTGYRVSGEIVDTSANVMPIHTGAITTGENVFVIGADLESDGNVTAAATVADLKEALTPEQKTALSAAFYWDNISDNIPLLKNRLATQDKDIDGDEDGIDASDIASFKDILLNGSTEQLSVKDEAKGYNEVPDIDITDLVFLNAGLNN